MYHLVFVLLILGGKADPSSSLGYGFIIIFWCILALIVQAVLLYKKVLIAKNATDTIALVIASPIGLSILGLILSVFLRVL